MRRIYDSYLSAQLDEAPVETRALLHLITLLPSDTLYLSDKGLFDRENEIDSQYTNLRWDPGLYSFTGGWWRSTQKHPREHQEGGLQDQDRGGRGEGAPRREYKCKICEKKCPRFGCSYKCKRCNKKGHRSEGCWAKFPEKAPGYVSPVNKDKQREETPGPNKKPRDRRLKSLGGSDRGSAYDASGSKAGSPHRYRRKRHRSKRVMILSSSGSLPTKIINCFLRPFIVWGWWNRKNWRRRKIATWVWKLSLMAWYRACSQNSKGGSAGSWS